MNKEQTESEINKLIEEKRTLYKVLSPLYIRINSNQGCEDITGRKTLNGMMKRYKEISEILDRIEPRIHAL